MSGKFTTPAQRKMNNIFTNNILISSKQELKDMQIARELVENNTFIPFN